MSSQALTGATIPPSLIHTGVQRVISMTLWAVGFDTLVSACQSSFNIFSLGNHLKMIGFNAKSDSTQMVPLKTFLGAAYQKVVSILDTTASKITIPSWVLGACPNPASSQVRGTVWNRAIDIDVMPEAFKSKMGLHLGLLLLGVMRSAVDAVRPLPIVPEGAF